MFRTHCSRLFALFLYYLCYSTALLAFNDMTATLNFDFYLSESGSEYSGEGENKEEFDELDHREDGQFWSTTDEPVERAETPDYEPYHSDDERPTPPPVISLFAVGKLCR